MGLVQSVAVGEAHALALGFFTKGVENGHPNPAAGRGKPDNVVIIPIDYSNHSETAFECEYSVVIMCCQHVVIILSSCCHHTYIDYSNHSETAFECKYILLLSFIVVPIYFNIFHVFLPSLCLCIFLLSIFHEKGEF